MAFHDAGDEGEAEAGAFLFLCEGIVGAVEAFEDAFAVGVADADAAVLDGDGCGAVAFGDVHGDLGSTDAVFRGVFEEVAKREGDAVGSELFRALEDPREEVRFHAAIGIVEASLLRATRTPPK